MDAEAKALNEKLKAYQEKVSRRTAGLHDAAGEAQARGEAMRNSAALNLRNAEHCEQLTKVCLETCGTLSGSEVKAAIERCNDNGKVIRDFREQATRDDIQAKRAQRGVK